MFPSRQSRFLLRRMDVYPLESVCVCGTKLLGNYWCWMWIRNCCTFQSVRFNLHGPPLLAVKTPNSSNMYAFYMYGIHTWTQYRRSRTEHLTERLLLLQRTTRTAAAKTSSAKTPSAANPHTTPVLGMYRPDLLVPIFMLPACTHVCCGGASWNGPEPRSITGSTCR